MKWVSQLNEYDVEIRYRHGPKNKPADFLSRLPEEVSAMMSPESGATLALGYGGLNLTQEQCKDDNCHLALLVLQGTVSDDRIPESNQAAVKQLVKECTVSQASGCLIQKYDSALRFVVPVHLRTKVLEQCHDSITGGHLSVEKTLGKVLLRPPPRCRQLGSVL